MWYHTASIQGRRPYNEDEIDVVMNLDGGQQGVKNINYLSIFDGHGGNAIRKYLKNNLQRYFMSNFVDKDPCRSRKYDKYIEKVFDLIQNTLTNCELPSKATGSTALVSLIYRNNSKLCLKVVNLGDCRAIVCNQHGIAVPLTKDHKPLSYNEYKRITELKGKITQEPNDDPRVNGMAVSRAFGDLDAKPHISHTPDSYDYDVADTQFLVMACDGLWDVLNNQDVVDFILSEMDTIKVTENLTNAKAKKNIAAKLANLAYEKGSVDNISVIILFFDASKDYRR